MNRLTNVLKGKAYLKEPCTDGEDFQELVNKLAEYEGLDEQGFVIREKKENNEGKK